MLSTQLTVVPPQTLTGFYHLTQRKINIRKETSTSINVFSTASFLSMVALLAHTYTHQPDYPQMPMVAFAWKLWEEAVLASGGFFKESKLEESL